MKVVNECGRPWFVSADGKIFATEDMCKEYEEEFIYDNRHTSVGQYINLWDAEGNYDVYIHVHEADDYLTYEEVGEIEDIVFPMMENDDKTVATDDREQQIVDAIKHIFDMEPLVNIVKRSV